MKKKNEDDDKVNYHQGVNEIRKNFRIFAINNEYTVRFSLFCRYVFYILNEILKFPTPVLPWSDDSYAF